MRVSVVELRKRLHEVLKVLDNNGQVTILYHGVERGIIFPINKKYKNKKKVKDFDFFGMHKNKVKTVEEEMEVLRGARY